MCSHLEMCVPRSHFSYCTLLQHPPMHSCDCCNALGRSVAVVRGGNHLKTSQKKQDRPIQTDIQLLLLSPPIRLIAIMPLICFFDDTKSEMIVINYLPIPANKNRSGRVLDRAMQLKIMLCYNYGYL